MKWFIIGAIASFAFLFFDQKQFAAWLAAQPASALQVGAPGTPTANIANAGGGSSSSPCGCGSQSTVAPVPLITAPASAPVSGFGAGPSVAPYGNPNASEFYWQTLENE